MGPEPKLSADAESAARVLQQRHRARLAHNLEAVPPQVRRARKSDQLYRHQPEWTEICHGRLGPGGQALRPG